jgi:amino acid transporter
MSFLRRLIGKPLDLRDKNIFHHVSLIAFFAWVGLGADGLSSSAYGPEEAFRHLAGHEYLAVFLALVMATTVFVISSSYTRIVEEFPTGGGGYLVASKLLGERAGVISGCALLVDYVLTISISIASGANAVFAFLPAAVQPFKLEVEMIAIAALVIMNLRGVKESVLVLTPIFLTFLVTHAILIFGVIVPHLGEAGTVVEQVKTGLGRDLSTMGVGALLLVFARAYSLGGGTFTGIEAVSNGLSIMREPRVRTGKRTMLLMAISLAFTASGILLAYLLLGVRPNASEPMNATLAKMFAGDSVGAQIFVVLTLVSEGALLFVAAQAGFIDGPRVMSNMALDSWLPHQFAALSERLTMRNGVYLMGGAALAVLVYTGGDVHALVVMYSINVFLTFSMSNLGMTRLWISRRHTEPRRVRKLTLHAIALAMCASILVITVYEKFGEGGWITLLVTAATIVVCYLVRRHYRMVGRKVARLNEELVPLLAGLPDEPPAAGAAALGGDAEPDPHKPTAVVLVGGYGGLGLHTLLSIERAFPGQFRQAVFVSAGVIDSGSFKGAHEIDALRASVEKALASYVQFARRKLGWAAASDLAIGTEAVSELERLCREVSLRLPRSVFFAGQLVFREPSWADRLLHNMTAYAVQRRLQFDGLTMVVLPVRVLS